MKTRLLWAQVLAVVLLTATSVGAAAPATARKVPVTDNAQALADLIDQQIERRLTKVDVKPVALADDSEFLRRTYLDLAGRIPTVEESRSFLNDNRGDRRARLIEQLLTSPRYTAHFTNVWRALLIPEASNNFQIRLQQGTFEGWIRTRLAKNVGYDRIVRDLITAPVSSSGFSPASLTGQGPPSSLPFYIAKELKAENLAAGTARVFLGVSVECAQCHNHPFANWTREQFWSFAAFFSGIKSQRAQDFILPGSEEPNKRSIPMPGTGKVVQARFLDGHDPLWRPGVNTRTILAEWLTAPTNPYFARATVNRMWSYFLGTGLVEPVDEMAGTSANASHPELLDLLAHEFVTHDFDLKYIIRAITLSKTYQRSSAGPLSPSMESSLFARMPLRGLTPEQLFDSVALATGFRDSGTDENLLTALFGGKRSARSEFLTKFASSERPTESQMSILQALTLMNGKVIADATSLEKSETLAAVVDSPFVSTAERVETLYLATVSRKPTAREIERVVVFVEDAVKRAGGPDEKSRAAAYSNALADVFWALLNSPEFVVNH